MSQDKKATWKNLDRLWRDPNIGLLNIKGNKYAIMSDIHLGDGKDADDFRKNEDALKRALDHYKKNGYKLILLGDIEEFWQFDLHSIKGRYDNTVYKKIRALGDANVFRVWGNHDSEWKVYDDPLTTKKEKGTTAHEALQMTDASGEPCILLLHGHQGSTESDKNSWLSRTVVRLLKGPEAFARRLGLYGNPSATKSRVAKDYEHIFYTWAKKNKMIVICGHSHRAIFASESYIERLKAEMREARDVILSLKANLYQRIWSLLRILRNTWVCGDELLKRRRIFPADPGQKPLPCYFNTGCALYTQGITAIEIADDRILLVRWNRKKKQEEPEELEVGLLSEFIKKVREG